MIISYLKSQSTYRGFYSFMARSLVWLVLMFVLTLVFFFTAFANDALSTDHHALICHIVDRREPWVDPTVSCISTKTIQVQDKIC